MTTTRLIGYASGNGAGISGCGDAPEMIKDSSLFSELYETNTVKWGDLFSPADPAVKKSHLPTITTLSQQLAKAVDKAVAASEFFITVGGDHSCGIGTWSGAAHAYRDRGDIGLIWFDAHLDAHTFDTTPSGNIHGMPVACLLGHGDAALISILDKQPKLKPENLVFIGSRSYEDGEHTLLKRLGVKIYYMEEVLTCGFTPIFQEALAIVKANTVGYGISIDLDGLDPEEAPGVGSPEVDGVHTEDLYRALALCKNDTKLIGAEIAEFNPRLDQEHKTAKITLELLKLLTRGK